MNAPSPHSSATPADLRPFLDEALVAVYEHRKDVAEQHMTNLDRAMGLNWHPARLALRAAQCAVDIGRWELATSRLIEVGDLLDPHSSVEG